MSRSLLLVVALAVGVRLAVVGLVASDQQRVFNSDAYEFHLLAKNLLASGHLTRDVTPPFTPEVARTPGFPGVVAGLYRLFGPDYVVVLFFNVALAGVTAAVLGRAGGPFGTTAALIYAIDPTSILYSAMFVAENLLTVLVLGAVVLLGGATAATPRRASLAAAAAGLLAGAAVLAKPVATYLPLLLLPAALASRGRRPRALRLVVPFAVAWGLLVGPWLVRNRIATGIATVSSIQEINLLFWNVAVMEGRRQGVDRKTAEIALRAELEARAGGAFDELAHPARLRAARALAVHYISAHPLEYARVHLRGGLLTLLDPGRLDVGRMMGGVDWGFSLLGTLTQEGLLGLARALRERPPALMPALIAIAGWLGLLYMAAARGLWRGRRSLVDDPLPLLMLLTAVYLVMIGGPIGNARFRVPIVPYLAVFAAAGLARREPA